MKRNLLIFTCTLLLGSVLGWIWGYWHYMNEAWKFPFDAITNIFFWDMPIEDWCFYPITGGFFATLVIFDPLRPYIKFTKNLEELHDNKQHLLIIYLFLIILITIGVFLSKSAAMTAVFFGIPALVLIPFLQEKFQVFTFYRTGIVVIPMEIIWDHWAVGRHGQWEYFNETGVFSTYNINNVPLDMTPYMPFLATYFICSIVFLFDGIFQREQL